MRRRSSVTFDAIVPIPVEQKGWALRNAVLIGVILVGTAVTVPKLSRVSVDVDYTTFFRRSDPPPLHPTTQLRSMPLGARGPLVDSNLEFVDAVDSDQVKASMHLRGGAAQDVIDAFDSAKHGLDTNRLDHSEALPESLRQSRPESLRGGGGTRRRPKLSRSVEIN
eukprot:CAMPEP_0181316242 /NCGR_PEP_ID=MMETSP1101-20121128/15792_1 /TAXON_ID=46948 /ORGANISM="Rhodomonas abbreviata, Strain Caron Lab Isolate" /LENGTH=165 /DNA_ID=CAMNT_0023423479 /DNA_START=307 /DNA_END=804 /DNA_ORIENTATION=+